jgi:hypothetical protein
MAPAVWARAGKQRQASLHAEGVACCSSRMVGRSAVRPGKMISGTCGLGETVAARRLRMKQRTPERLLSAALHAVLLWPNGNHQNEVLCRRM